MPTYEYQCPKCGRFETYQKITEPAIETCPSCGAPVRRLLSRNVNILFKGSGFHVNDYRSASYKEGAKKEEPAAPTSKTA